jgi:segregation and condensation protein B
MTDEPHTDATSLDAEDLQHASPDDQGLSLEELSQAYANLLEQGEDPYAQAPARDAAADDALPDEVVDEEEVEETSLEDGQELSDVSPQSILEAMLFVGHPDNEPLTSQKVASFMRGVRPQEIDELVVQLNQIYEEEGCPYCIASVGPGYQLVLREEFGALRDKFYGRIKAARLSQAAIDILAIVAYRQPLTREEVDRLRGKPSGAILTQLVRRELLCVQRPAEKPRTPRYLTTDRFLDLFGLESLQDLPKSPD